MLERIPHPEDFSLAQRCLEGDEQAIAQVQDQYGTEVRTYLVGRGATPAEAKEIVDSLWADCLAPGPGRRPRIAGYQGGAALRTWLNTVAMNTFVTLRRNQALTERLIPVRLDVKKPATEGAGGDIDGGGRDLDPEQTIPAEDQPAAEAPLIHMLREAVEAAFRNCSAEDFVLLQLAHCEGVRQADLARMWKCDAATISRRLRRAGEDIASRVAEFVSASDPWLDLNWHDFLELCQVASPTCFGREA